MLWNSYLYYNRSGIVRSTRGRQNLSLSLSARSRRMTCGKKRHSSSRLSGRFNLVIYTIIEVALSDRRVESLYLRTLPANDAWKKKGRKTLLYLKKLFSLKWKRASRVPREDLGSSPSLGGTTTGWPPVLVRPWDLAARCVLTLAPTGKWWVLPRATSRWWQVAA